MDICCWLCTITRKHSIHAFCRCRLSILVIIISLDHAYDVYPGNYNSRSLMICAYNHFDKLGSLLITLDALQSKRRPI